MLGREMVNKTGRQLKVSIGRPIPPQKLEGIRDDLELTRYLRLRVQLLRANHKAARRRQVWGGWIPRSVTVAAPECGENLAREIAWLRPDQKLAEAGSYRVYIAAADQIPCALREIARLREVTFRAVGEGTGGALDLDVFDRFYQHLFVWNEEKSEVVGAYRLGLTDKILPQFGLSGLYTNTLFKYDFDHVRALNPAIEIGRSFVRQEYQRKHLPLLLLWKGIGTYVARNPRYRNLFGTVSMSSHYAEASRQLVARFFEQGKPNRSVYPRNPLRLKGSPVGDGRDSGCRIPDLEALSEMVSEIEPDGKGIPVLMRQYIKLGGRVLACNVDAKFNMALDALLVVDLSRTDPRLLEIYMGKLTAGYLHHHDVVLREEREAQCA
jgi:putative hemolysin